MQAANIMATLSHHLESSLNATRTFCDSSSTLSNPDIRKHILTRTRDIRRLYVLLLEIELLDVAPTTLVDPVLRSNAIKDSRKMTAFLRTHCTEGVDRCKRAIARLVVIEDLWAEVSNDLGVASVRQAGS